MAATSRSRRYWQFPTALVLLGSVSACTSAKIETESTDRPIDESSTTDYPYSITDSSTSYDGFSYTDTSADTSAYTDTSESDGESGPPTETRNGVEVIMADGVSRPLSAPCFVSSSLVIPQEWEYLIAPEGCNFAFQGAVADVNAIAGEMWMSSSGKSFDEQANAMIANIEAGTEPDIKFLGLMNSGPGEPLTILNRWDNDSPTRSVIVQHTSNRHGTAYSAIVEVPPSSDGATNVILIWAGLTPDNESFLFDFVQGLTTMNLD